MHFEDQDQLLALMEMGHYDFNKMGIKQRISAKTSFIFTANPIEGNWRDPTDMDLSEILLMKEVKDRIDHIWFFKTPRNEEVGIARDNRLELARKHVREDKEKLYYFLRTYIYYVRTNPELQELKFNDPQDEERLADLWESLAKSFPDVVGNRAFDTIYRVASEFARLMLKPAIDSEVIDQTIQYITTMYKQFGRSATVAEIVDKRATAYNSMCKVIKEHSQNQYWASQNSPEAKIQLADITFEQAAELASGKNETTHRYLGNNFKSNSSRPSSHLRKMFRERQNEDYDGGKIKVTSKDERSEMTLKWISNDNKETSEDSSNEKNDENYV